MQCLCLGLIIHPTQTRHHILHCIHNICIYLLMPTCLLSRNADLSQHNANPHAIQHALNLIRKFNIIQRNIHQLLFTCLPNCTVWNFGGLSIPWEYAQRPDALADLVIIAGLALSRINSPNMEMTMELTAACMADSVIQVFTILYTQLPSVTQPLTIMCDLVSGNLVILFNTE